MTKIVFTSYAAFLCMAVVLAGVTTVHASEVTGTLSSDTSQNTQTTGNISGTVSSNGTTGSIGGTVAGVNNGGSSSGSKSSRSSSSGSSSSRPAGSVSGASIDNSQTPNFPNAGFAPEESMAGTTLWSVIANFLKNIVSF